MFYQLIAELIGAKDMDKKELDRKCELILEQVRLRLVDGQEAIERLKEFYRKLS